MQGFWLLGVEGEGCRCTPRGWEREIEKEEGEGGGGGRALNVLEGVPGTGTCGARKVSRADGSWQIAICGARQRWSLGRPLGVVLARALGACRETKSGGGVGGHPAQATR